MLLQSVLLCVSSNSLFNVFVSLDRSKSIIHHLLWTSGIAHLVGLSLKCDWLLKVLMKAFAFYDEHTCIRDTVRTKGWTFALCPPSGEWGPGRNTGGIRRRGMEMVTLPHKALSRKSGLSNWPSQCMDPIWDLPLPFFPNSKSKSNYLGSFSFHHICVYFDNYLTQWIRKTILIVI